MEIAGLNYQNMNNYGNQNINVYYFISFFPWDQVTNFCASCRKGIIVLSYSFILRSRKIKIKFIKLIK